MYLGEIKDTTDTWLFRGATFLQFSRRVYIIYVRRTDMFFQDKGLYMFFKQTQICQEGLSNRHVFSRRVYLFDEQILLSHRTDINFPRNPYFIVLKHIHILQETLIFSSNRYQFPKATIFSSNTILIFQEALSSPRTPYYFPGDLYPSNR